MTTTEDPETLAQPSSRSTCLRCGVKIEPRLFRVSCDSCAEKEEQQMANEARDKWLRERRLKWADVLEMYQAKSFADHPHWWPLLSPTARAAGNEWLDKHLKAGLDRGLGLVGQPGTGKTVTVGYCAYQAYMRGYSVAITSDPHLAALAEDPETRWAQSVMQGLLTADVLVLDDIGQCCGAGLGRKLMLRLVHQRFTAGRKLLWTSQGGMNYIAIMMGCKADDQGRAALTEDVAAFVRRLSAPFCRYVTINPGGGK